MGGSVLRLVAGRALAIQTLEASPGFMENPYLSMLQSALWQLVPYIPYLGGLLVFALALKVLEPTLGRKKRHRWSRSYARRGKDRAVQFGGSSNNLADRIPDAADQLRTVMQA